MSPPPPQAETIFENHMMQTEAHVHVLSNLKARRIVILEHVHLNKSTRRIASMLFEPGWQQQCDTAPAVLKSLAKGPNPPIFMHFGAHHYSAYLPACSASLSDVVGRGKKEAAVSNSKRVKTREDGRGKERAIMLD